MDKWPGPEQRLGKTVAKGARCSKKKGPSQILNMQRMCWMSCVISQFLQSFVLQDFIDFSWLFLAHFSVLLSILPELAHSNLFRLQKFSSKLG